MRKGEGKTATLEKNILKKIREVDFNMIHSRKIGMSCEKLWH
jgi:hypothetical protein